MDKTVWVGVNTWENSWEDFSCIENLWRYRGAGFSNRALKGIQTFCFWRKHIFLCSSEQLTSGWSVCSSKHRQLYVYGKKEKRYCVNLGVLFMQTICRSFFRPPEKEMQQWHPVAQAVHGRWVLFRAESAIKVFLCWVGKGLSCF